MQPIIQLNDVFAAYDKKVVLKNINLTIDEHDFLGIIGPNGGGKTTLIRLILGLKKPMKGQLLFYKEGKPVKHLTMGYLPQYNAIDPDFPISVEEVVLSGLSNLKKLCHPFTSKHHLMVSETLEKMQLSELRNRAIGTLSGGQLQRVLLARAIVSHPTVLVLDEPNTYIDRHFQTQMYEMLHQIHRHCAILLVSHDIGAVLQNAQNIAYVNRKLDYHVASDLSAEDLQGCFHQHSLLDESWHKSL